MSETLTVDRHAFASNASSFDTAWQTFGWTPGLGRARAGRLEEQVPWATLAAKASAPARLSGAPKEILAPANFDALQWGFLPLDGRHGYSVWGAIGERRNGEWRVLTHTLLFDDAAFDLIAGFPHGLMTMATHGGWFTEMLAAAFAEPAELAPISIARTRATRQAFERARRAELARLRARLLSLVGGEERLGEELAGLLEALAQVRAGGNIRHVAMRSSADLRTELLVRFAWLSLPLADRAETSFVTEQRRTESPRVTLFVLPESEWGQFVPQATRLLEPGRAHADRAARGRRQWARSVARGDHRELDARIESRRWRVIARDDLSAIDAYERWRERWLESADRRDLARELLALEINGEGASASGRTRAAAHLAACAFAGHADAGSTLFAVFRAHPAAATGLVRTGVRTLMRGDREAQVQALLLRCEAVLARDAVPPTELFRLFEREAPLVPLAATDGRAAAALFRAAFTAGCAGHAAAERLIAASIPGLVSAADVLLAAIETNDIGDPRVARITAQAIGHALRTSADVDGVAAVLLARLAGRAVPQDLIEPLLRLLWLERRTQGRSSAVEFAQRAGADAWPVLLPLLVAPAPLPLFLELRAALAEARAPREAAVAPWLGALDEYSPALRHRVRGGLIRMEA